MASASVSSAPPLEAGTSGKLLSGEHTLPSSWWSSEKVFDLEKRSIFNKSWLFCTHSSRFKKAGDYYAFNVVGINFFIIKSKVDGELKAFHNVCRHRAFPIVRKEKGSSIVLGCKYHGWSYDSNGSLKKAPHFEQVEGFKKEENSLFPIKTHTTPHGLVFVNFSTSDDVIPFEEWYKGLYNELDEFDFSDYEYNMSYEMSGDFNWKTLMDGYQECYHCPTAHPGLNSAFKMETYAVVAKNRYCRHYAEIVRQEPEQEEEEEKEQEEGSSWFGFGKSKAPEKPKKAQKVQKENPGGESDGLWVYLFPNNGINCYSPAWYSIRVLPISATKTILQYDIYAKKGLAQDKIQEFVDFLQLVELEDFNLCQLTQKNLNEGVYSTGYLHPHKENGVLFYQGLVRDMVKEHYEIEKKNGGPVNPAFTGRATSNKDVQQLEEICNELECGGSNPESELEW